MKRYLLLSVFIVVTATAESQGIVKETWDEKPTLHYIENNLMNESAVIILDSRRVEYIDENNEVVMYKTLHKIIRINDDKGIETFNRIYLPVTDNSDIIDIKARTILPGGKLIEISKKNIKDLKEEDDRIYKIFAMEGLEKGCEVEYFYTYKRNTGFFGSEIFQGKLPVLEARFDVVAPARLIFEMKTYNSQTKPQDTIVKEKRWMSIVEKKIPVAEDEKYCSYEANLKRVEYKLSYNTSGNASNRLMTWDELAKKVYEIYGTYSEKEIKKVNDLISDMEVKRLATESEKIAAVENYIKTNFTTREDINGEDAQNLERIVKTRLAGHFGIVRLYSAVFSQLDIPHEYVLSASRKKYSIEKNFENWHNCENPVIYFPALKKCLAPTLSEFRFPWIDPDWGSANALYCKKINIGNLTTALAEIRTLDLEDYSKSVINTEADLKLNESADTLLVNISQIYSGYSAATYKAIFNYSPDEYQKKITKEMIRFATKSEYVVSSKLENQDFESYHQNKPFILSATVKASELVEKAGNKTIIKIGDIIGPQVEMYQEKPRQFPMEIDYPHVLERKIIFTIPEGYVVKNLNDLKINYVYQDGGKTTMGFTSTYQLQGNVIKMHILEEYRITRYPLSQFEDFKKVINAAADFNKIALVLEKK